MRLTLEGLLFAGLMATLIGLVWLEIKVTGSGLFIIFAALVCIEARDEEQGEKR